jgi:hypothetical protein
MAVVNAWILGWRAASLRTVVKICRLGRSGSGCAVRSWQSLAPDRSGSRAAARPLSTSRRWICRSVVV